MLSIRFADIEKDINNIRELFNENLSEVHPIFARDFNINLDVNELLAQDIAKLNQFTAPNGGLFLAQVENKNVGCAGFRQNSESIAEVKRMYVKPEYRRQGIGRTLLQAIINQTSNIGYSKLRLDTPDYAQEAQSLYRSFGFKEISPYLESDIPEELHPKWIFMELTTF
ncbi:GCN5-related N-acetyltransferase [Calothrix sp. NIES-4071]|nr:GCN5-related N-acetyltransferase [Calothrix sp. NIES-4071]BAZ61824.1 GCN5-related N-acetyltransferase [Calothrix sp. NIES-4105]